MKKLFASILCLGMIFGATGCTSGGDDTYEIAMITDSGSVTDKSFNQSAYEGVKEFGEKNDISYKYYAPKDTDQAGLLSTIDDAVDNGAKVVVTPGFNFSGALYQAQEKYPDVKRIELRVSFLFQEPEVCHKLLERAKQVFVDVFENVEMIVEHGTK